MSKKEQSTYNLKPHPFSLSVPPPTTAQREALLEDIDRREQGDPITLYQGQILDGNSRYDACRRLGKEPKTAEFQGSDDDAKAFVFSKNFARRHINKHQAAFHAAEHLLPDYEREAKERQGERTDLQEPPGENAQKLEDRARDRAARAVGVGSRLVADAKAVLLKATKKNRGEVSQAVRAGIVNLTEAKHLLMLHNRDWRKPLGKRERDSEFALLTEAKRILELRQRQLETLKERRESKRTRPTPKASVSTAPRTPSAPAPEAEQATTAPEQVAAQNDEPDDTETDELTYRKAVLLLDELGEELLSLGRRDWSLVRDEIDVWVNSNEAQQQHIDAVREFLAAR